jgi:putative FmdB family regulatory protein
MPLYEYKCGDCGHEFEALVPMAAADEPRTCPVCGSDKSERLLSVFSSGPGSAASSAKSGCGGGGSPFT